MRTSVTFKSPLHEMTQTTPTCLWNDSAALAELQYSMQHGAVGATCNPVIVLDVLKRHDVRLVTYVPDNVLRPLIEGAHADPFFTTFTTTREEEAVGIVCGAWMGGRRGIVLMQTSGFATLANTLASLPVPSMLGR